MLNKSFLLGCLFFISLHALGQAARSPMSYLGFGETYGSSLVHNQGMAGVGISNPQYFYLNNQNPALLVFNRFTVFGAGFIGEQRKTTGEQSTEKNFNGNLNYLATAFPVKLAKWTASIGLSPYSTVNYQLNYTSAIQGSTSTANVVESGAGGINQFYWSNGVALTESLSIGLKTSYLFGSVINEYSNNISSNGQPIIYYPNVYERNYVKDLTFSGGISFHKDSLFNDNYKFNLGMVYDFKTNVNTEYYLRVERRNIAGIVDSTSLINNVPGKLILPSVVGFGASFGKGENWTLGADFTYLDYTKITDFSGNPVNYGTTGYRSAIGFEITPDPYSIGNYLKRMTFRTGLNYDQFPYLINGNKVKDFGINFGFSMPVNRVSNLDFAVRFGKRGNLKDNTIEENYLKVYFGVTFNDQWFIRRRFD